MFLNKKPTANNNIYTWSLCAFCIAIIPCIYCKNGSDSTKQVYFDKVFNKVDAPTYTIHSYTDSGMAYLDAAFAGVDNPGTYNLARKYVRKLIYYRATTFNYDSTLLFADSAISLLQNNADNKDLAILYATALFAKGNIYFKLKNYDEAIRNYTIGKLILSDKVKDSCELFTYYESMANILYAQQKYRQAAELFRTKYLTMEKCTKDPYTGFLNVQENMDNTGICYFKAGLTDSAIHYYNATLDYINKNESRFRTPANKSTFPLLRSVVYSNQAEVLRRQKKFEDAEKFFLKSIDSTTSDKVFTEASRLSLTEMYIVTNQVEKATGIIKDLTATVDTSAVNITLINYYKLRSDYYEKVNRPADAHRFLLLAYNAKDSVEKRDLRFNATDVSREIENREQKALNEGLKKDTEIKNNYLLIAVISTIMAVVVILLIWYNLKRKSHYVKKLTFLNTEIRKRNNDLHKTLSSLEQSHMENNRIMRVVAHDLKNPISAIRSLVYSLLKKGQEEPNKEILELIQSTCQESIILIKDLLDNKRNLSDISKELVDMGRLIEQCSELFQVKAGEKKQHLKLQVDHPVIMLNRQKMLRVISNIVNNAIKFSPENSEITIRLERKDNSVLLSVHDNGIGIPSDLKDKIFSIDHDTSREGTAGEESYGLGLSISRKIIEEHEGKLWFESEAGKGSVFFVELPYMMN